jgi:hypothetical protein
MAMVMRFLCGSWRGFAWNGRQRGEETGSFGTGIIAVPPTQDQPVFLECQSRYATLNSN